jgi:Fungal Zn(2)-Cys(6) binuclear cluster domain
MNNQAWSCSSCRKRKQRCDDNNPCSLCIRLKHECVRPGLAGKLQSQVNGLKSQLEQQERRLQDKENIIRTLSDREAELSELRLKLQKENDRWSFVQAFSNRKEFIAQLIGKPNEDVRSSTILNLVLNLVAEKQVKLNSQRYPRLHNRTKSIR